MTQTTQEKLDESISTLKAVVEGWHSSAVQLPPTEKIWTAIQFLGERFQISSEVGGALRLLEVFPPIIDGRLIRVAQLLIERAGDTPCMTTEEIEADKKLTYLRSAQYDQEGPINWALLIANIVAAIYLARDLVSRQLTNDHLFKFSIFCLPVLFAIPALLKPRKRTSVFGRYLEYRSISGQHLLSYQDWLAGHGRGTDVRPSRRQGVLILVFYVLFMTITILELSPAK